jgi:hypothetical protein
MRSRWEISPKIPTGEGLELRANPLPKNDKISLERHRFDWSAIRFG